MDEQHRWAVVIKPSAPRTGTRMERNGHVRRVLRASLLEFELDATPCPLADKRYRTRLSDQLTMFHLHESICRNLAYGRPVPHTVAAAYLPRSLVARGELSPSPRSAARNS